MKYVLLELAVYEIKCLCVCVCVGGGGGGGTRQMPLVKFLWWLYTHETLGTRSRTML